MKTRVHESPTALHALRNVARLIVARITRAADPIGMDEGEMWSRIEAAQALFYEQRTTHGVALLDAVERHAVVDDDVKRSIRLTRARFAMYGTRTDPDTYGISPSPPDQWKQMRPLDQENELACLMIYSVITGDTERMRQARDHGDRCMSDVSSSVVAAAVVARFGPLIDHRLSEHVDRSELYIRLASHVDVDRDSVVFGELSTCTHSREAWDIVTAKLGRISEYADWSKIVLKPYGMLRTMELVAHHYRLVSRPLSSIVARIIGDVSGDVGMLNRKSRVDIILIMKAVEMARSRPVGDLRSAMSKLPSDAVTTAYWRIHELTMRLRTDTFLEAIAEITTFVTEYPAGAAGPNQLEEYRVLSSLVDANHQPDEARRRLLADVDSSASSMLYDHIVATTLIGRVYEGMGDLEGAREMYNHDAVMTEDFDAAVYVLDRALGAFRIADPQNWRRARRTVSDALTWLGSMVVSDLLRNASADGATNPRLVCRILKHAYVAEQALTEREHRAAARELHRVRDDLERQIRARRADEERLSIERISLLEELLRFRNEVRSQAEPKPQLLQEQTMHTLQRIRELLHTHSNTL